MTKFNKKLLLEAVEFVKQAAAADEAIAIKDQRGREIGTMQWVQDDWLTVPRPRGYDSFDDEEVIGVNLLGDKDLDDAAECGTGCCVAGYIAIRKYRPANVKPITLSALWEKVIDEHLGWERFGANALGITLEEAGRLFESLNDVDAIVGYADQLIANYEKANA